MQVQVAKILQSYIETMSDNNNNNSNWKPKKGLPVELKGLISQPKLNGSIGVIISKFNKETGRWGVRLDDGSCISVKPCNLSI